jgi:glutathione peroxidase
MTNSLNLKNKCMALLAGLALFSGVSSAQSSVLNHSYRELAGKQPVNLQKKYTGQVLLVVNTASKCGYTSQYEGLEALHARLKAKGFTVLGFPSNDFRGQEPGTEKEIQAFCKLTYGVKFPMFEKVNVVGDNATPFYKQLTSVTGTAPGWNFHKYLIDRKGNVVANYNSATKPDDAAMLAKIDELIAAKK